MTEGIAIVSQTPAVNMREIARAAAAVQIQVWRDLDPIWGVAVPISAFFRLEDAPLGYWCVVLRDDVAPRATGIHRFEGNPVGIVSVSSHWPLALSQVVLELLVNPTGHRRLVGASPAPHQGDVEFVAAVTAAGGNDFSYDVHGYPVSDFVRPSYYRGGGGPFDRTGTLSAPAALSIGGRLTWWDGATGRWWQQHWTADEPELTALDVDPDHDVHRQLRPWAPSSASADRGDTQRAGSATARPTGATHRAHRLNDMLIDLAARTRLGADPSDRDPATS